jgi:hypothetical protein
VRGLLRPAQNGTLAGALHADLGAAVVATGEPGDAVHTDDTERYAELAAELSERLTRG